MNTFLGIIRGCQDIIGTLIFGGVFERHPELRAVCVEADAGWVPHWMYRADHAFKRHRNWLTAELGQGGVDLLRKVKTALDPNGIMNPGVLIDP